jgi:hypothetical protein
MKKLFGIFTLLVLLASCTQYQVKRDIKNYEKQQGKTIESIEIKKCGSDYLWAAKIRYKTYVGYPTLPVYKVFSWDKYDYIREWNDSEMKKENLSYAFPEYIGKKH